MEACKQTEVEMMVTLRKHKRTASITKNLQKMVLGVFVPTTA